jgi:hypothetical protein
MPFTRIAFAFDAGTFAVMRALLESEGVRVLDMARGGHVAIAGVDQGFYLEVLAEDRVLAERILRENDFGKHVVAQPG